MLEYIQMSEFNSHEDSNDASKKPSDEWKQKARALAIIARKGLDDTAPDKCFVPNYKDPTYEGPYGDLSTRLWVEFVNQARSCGDQRYVELATKTSIAQGFNSLCRILSFAPAAYIEYCNQNGSKLDLYELGEILHRSKAIIELFAKRDNSSNVTLETNFGLRRFPPAYDEIPFIIAPNVEGELAFLPAPYSLNETKLDIYRWEQEKDKNARCPANGYVLSIIWDKAVDACINEQQLFPTSLGLTS